jgi:hypothetical protein
MSQAELDQLVAGATGESVHVIRALGFGIADPLDVSFDPEPCRRPLYYDWDSQAVAEWRW